MKKLICSVMAIILALGMDYYTTSASNVIEDPDDIDSYSSVCNNENEWYESETGIRAWPHTYTVVNAYVGQVLKEKFIVRNFSNKTRTYSISRELMDNENKYAWLPDDSKSITIDKTKLTLKPKEKAIVTVTIKILKNHSANAYFHINIKPDTGSASFLVLDIAQFDTMQEISNSKPPTMFKTLSDALKNKTKLGRMVKKYGRTFLVYGNIHLFCFDTKTGKFQWYFNHGYSIVDLTVLEKYVFTHKSFLDIKTGKETYCGQSYWLKFIYDGKVYVSYGKNDCQARAGSNESPSMPMDGPALDQLVCKKYLTNEILWQSPSPASFWAIKYPFVMPKAPGRLFINLGAFEFSYDSMMCLDATNGKKLIQFKPSKAFIKKPDQNLIISVAAGGMGLTNEEIEIWDVVTAKKIFASNACGGTDFTDTGSIIYFADAKQTCAYNYVNRKVLWKNSGDGAILASPLVDPSGKYVYFLDEDSVWSCGDLPQQTKKPKNVRMFKFDSATGKMVWKADIMKVPADIDSFFGEYGADASLGIDNGKITITLQEYTFYIRASDGKPWK